MVVTTDDSSASQQKSTQTARPALNIQGRSSPVASPGYFTLAWRKLRRDRVAMFGLVLIGLIVLARSWPPCYRLTIRQSSSVKD